MPADVKLDDDHVTVEGVLDARSNGIVASDGEFSGTLKAEMIQVLGRFDARGHAFAASDGAFTGTLKAQEIEVLGKFLVPSVLLQSVGAAPGLGGFSTIGKPAPPLDAGAVLRTAHAFFDQPRRVQDQWRWCSQCQSLFYAGSGIAGVCAAGKTHSGKGSFNYVLFPGGSRYPGQSGWKWCCNCQALFFPIDTKGKSACPAKLGPHDASRSPDYVMHATGDADFDFMRQEGWRFCSECAALYYLGNAAGGTVGRCSATGKAHALTQSSAYVVSY